MDILLIDHHSAVANTWAQFAELARFDLRTLSHWGGLETLPDAPVYVLDQSVVTGDYGDTVCRLAEARPHSVIIASASHLEVDSVVRLMRCGAQYVLQKPYDLTRLQKDLADLRQVLQRKEQEKAEFEVLDEQFSNLTKREQDVLEYVLQGVSNKNAASNLQVSVRTIEARRAKVYQKTGSSHVVELVRKVDRFRQLKNLFTPSLTQTSVRSDSGNATTGPSGHGWSPGGSRPSFRSEIPSRSQQQV